MERQETLNKMTDKVFEALKEVLEKEQLSVVDYKIEAGTIMTQSSGTKFKINITLETP